jgi:shikimate dehydrogenase
VRSPTGATRVAGVIGDPVGHSLSPVLHNAAFAALGLDWVYVAFPVPAGQGTAAVAAVRALGLSGLSVTMPHKADVARAVDRLTPVAARLGVVNTVLAAGGEIVGDSTDGAGFVDALRADEGWDPSGRRCVVLGAGGAARAVCLALADAGARRVVVVGRQRAAVERCAALAGPAGRVGTIREVADAELVVNATPVGMDIPSIDPAGADPVLPLGLDPGHLGPGQLVADLVYAPAVTPLLRSARRAGAGGVNGLGMLLHQAGRQIEAWTGTSAPLDVMSAAALAALDARPR